MGILERSVFGNIVKNVLAEIGLPLSLTSVAETFTQPEVVSSTANANPDLSIAAGRLSQLKYLDIGSSAINISNSVALR